MSGRERILAPTAELVNRDGEFALGLRTQPFARVNPLDAHFEGPLGRRRGLRRLALKEWQHFALVDERFYLSVAIFDAKRIALVQIIVFDRRTRRVHEYERRALPRQVELPGALDGGRARFARGGFELEIHNHLDPSRPGEGRHQVRLRAPASGLDPAVEGEFTVYEPLDRVEPMVVALPFEAGRAMYSHKAVLGCEGHLRLGPETHEFEPARSYSLVDIHKGFYPFVMTWHWATGARPSKAGKLIGFNLTDNQVRDQSAYNENGLWVDGKLHPLGPVKFEFDDADHMAPWRIRDAEGRVELRFLPEALRKVDINLLLLRSRYRGPFGAFEGSIVDDHGERHDLDGCFGMCEDFYLRA